jgi:hypothetical protein
MAQYPKHELVGYLDLNITRFLILFAYPNFRPVKLGDWWQDESGHWHFGGATCDPLLVAVGVYIRQKHWEFALLH